MTQRCWLWLLLVIGVVQLGVAQPMPTRIRPGAYVAAGGAFSVYQIDYGKRTLGGASVYVDANLTTFVGIEAEARWLNLREVNDTTESTYLIGPRLQLEYGHVRPYAKLLVGQGRFNFPYNYATGRYFVLAPGAGVDVRVNDRFTVRLIDVEYQDWPQFTYGAIAPYGVSMGVSYRIR